jgi:putative transposase
MSRNSQYPVRKALPHGIPNGIDIDRAVFFVTVNCSVRGINHLCRDHVASVIFESAKHYADKGRWHPRLLLLMPDHVHLVATFALRESAMRDIIEPWKGWLRKKAGIVWQRGFFDHRLRDEREIQDKAYYVLLNPVRAGFVDNPEAWKWKRTPPW